MTFDTDALAEALDALAEQGAPPSRVDHDRIRRDGRRKLRRRRTAAGLGGTGAAALVTALVLGAVHVLGGAGGVGSAGGTTAPATVVHTADWDPMVAPATFGWLPDNAANINYSVAPGPGQGPAALGKGSMVSNGEVGHDPAMIWLIALDPHQPAPHAGPVDDGSGRILIAAPDVNGRAAFWEVDPKHPDPDQGAAGGLYFQSPSGLWAEVYGYYLGADPVADTLLHVARTAAVGAHPVPLPVQISGLPADATAQVADVQRPTTVPGAAWSVGLTFAVGAKNGMIEVEVYPGTAVLTTPDTGGKSDATATPGATATGTATGTGARQCKTDNGLLICVSTIGKFDPALLPGGVGAVLDGITSLGPDPADWSTDVVIVH